jgi:two-component system OmpR family sensor kinase
LLMVVVSVGLMAYLANLSTTHEFRQYLSSGDMMYTGTVADSLGQFYAQWGDWNDVQEELDSFLRSRQDHLVVVDSSGVVVADSAGQWLGEKANEVGLSGGTPVVVSGREVGEFYLAVGDFTAGRGRWGIGGMGGATTPVLDTAEQDFLSRVNSSLWITGLITAAAALLVGLVLTRQITRPIKALTEGARKIASGNLGYQVRTSARDEVGDLARSFNAMAAHLDQSEQTRRRLTADITHELRTPLTVIEGTVDGILDGVFQPDHDRLTSIKEQTGLLTRLIGDLRDLSLAESGQLKLERRATDLGELVRRKLSQSEAAARKKDIRLELNLTPELPPVYIDPARIEQVITNLISNALRHTPGGGSIAVSLASDTARETGKRCLVVSVRDTGEGIAPEHLPNVFERFYRAGDSRSRGEGGAGLGLAIVKQMVQAHGGQVWAESQPGRGSTFHLALPVERSESE